MLSQWYFYYLLSWRPVKLHIYWPASTSYWPQNNPQFLLLCISWSSSPTHFLCHENQDTFFFLWDTKLLHLILFWKRKRIKLLYPTWQPTSNWISQRTKVLYKKFANTFFDHFKCNNLLIHFNISQENKLHVHGKTKHICNIYYILRTNNSNINI